MSCPKNPAGTRFKNTSVQTRQHVRAFGAYQHFFMPSIHAHLIAVVMAISRLFDPAPRASLVRTSRLHTHWRRCDSESELKLRRECLDWIIPVSEDHLRKTLCAWLAHYNPRPTTLFVGARPSRSAPQSPRAAPTPEASFRPSKSSGGAFRIERTSPRVQPLGPCCLTVIEFLRTTHSRPSYSFGLEQIGRQVALAGVAEHHRTILPRRRTCKMDLK